MRKSRFREPQMVKILREADKSPIAEVAKKHGIGEQTIYAVGYKSRLAKRDAPVIAVMRELAAQYPRFGYRRIQIFLERRGYAMSADRAYRLWKQAELQVPRRRPRRRVATGRPRPLPATDANHDWAYDFVFDACANGQQIKCLTVIDEFTRECLAIDVAGSISSLNNLTPEQYARTISTKNPEPAIF